MKKFFLVLATIYVANLANAQTSASKSTVVLSKAGDHIMFQIGSDQWTGAPDSIASHKKGLSRGANIYIMMNKPFKSNNRFSAALGVGVSTSNVYFSKINIDIKSATTRLPFTDLSAANHFKKYKLTTAYLEAPIELRFTADPANESKSIKAALGVKIGQLLSVHTKGRVLEDASGKALNSYTQKETNKHFFNSTRLSATARIGYGHLSLFGSYSLSSMLKDGTGAAIKPYQVGICISGL